MKKVEHYICEICGTEYKDKKTADKCEKGHKKILKIVSKRYLPISVNKKGYPESIDVMMDDGMVLTYKR